MRGYVKAGLPQPIDHLGNDGRINVPPFELEHGFVPEIRMEPQDFIDLMGGVVPAAGLAVDHREHDMAVDEVRQPNPLRLRQGLVIPALGVMKQGDEEAIPAGLGRVAFERLPYERNAFIPVAGETVSSPEIGKDVAVMRIESKCSLVRRN